MAEPIYAQVLTRWGWYAMQDIMVGDEVLSADGDFYPVVNVIERDEMEATYRVDLTDGAVVWTTDDHLWGLDFDEGAATTAEIRERLAQGGDVFVPSIKPPAACPVDPTFSVLMTRGQRVMMLRALMDECGGHRVGDLFHFRTDEWLVAAVAYDCAYSLGGICLLGDTAMLAHPRHVVSGMTLEQHRAAHRAKRRSRMRGGVLNLSRYSFYIMLPEHTSPIARQIARVGHARFIHHVVDLVVEDGRPYVTKGWVATGG